MSDGPRPLDPTYRGRRRNDEPPADVRVGDLYAAAEAHRLVLLDPTRLTDVRGLWAAIRSIEDGQPELSTMRVQLALESLLPPLAPERIPEPGTWGVVEATCVHSDHSRHWVRFSDGAWYPADIDSACLETHLREQVPPGLPDEWHELNDPVLIRPGLGDPE